MSIYRLLLQCTKHNFMCFFFIFFSIFLPFPQLATAWKNPFLLSIFTLKHNYDNLETLGIQPKILIVGQLCKWAVQHRHTEMQTLSLMCRSPSYCTKRTKLKFNDILRVPINVSISASEREYVQLYIYVVLFTARPKV